VVATLVAMSIARPRAADADDDFELFRSGFTFGVGVGLGGVADAGDCCELSGAGGRFTIRVGTTATRYLLWMLQLDSGFVVIEDLGDEDKNKLNQQNTLTLGLQYYATEHVWIKVGAGFATYINRVDAEEETTGGLGTLGSVGYDLFRRGSFILDLEVTVNGGLYDGGAIAAGGAALAVQWY
jgi:hypothetical protein